ncbi:uncharacterized protein LOC114213458 [Eumetopias jubatus]|uniref:uncharacterized protein LOC114213458 n=1 Tax=Eumetopias jubatus TaxID=34886 RepID=UPI0010168760|nr:uncharacterized protein LOC114213458 [Eumetopias jubatus]
MPLALCRTGRTPPSRCPERPGEVLLPRAPPPGPQGCLSAGAAPPQNSSWQREEARQVSAVPSVPQLIIYLFVFNKKLTFSVKSCTRKITIVFQVESHYYRWVLEAVIKIFLDVKVPSGLAWVGSPKMGAALPRGQGRTEPGGGEGGGSAEVRGNPRLLGHQRTARSRGMSPGEEPFCENASAPQHASDLINPLGKDPGSGWQTDCGELEKLTCATIKRAAALSDSPPATETESSRTGRGGTWLLPPVPGEEDKKERWTWRWPRPSNAPILGN